MRKQYTIIYKGYTKQNKLLKKGFKTGFKNGKARTITYVFRQGISKSQSSTIWK